MTATSRSKKPAKPIPRTPDGWMREVDGIIRYLMQANAYGHENIPAHMLKVATYYANRLADMERRAPRVLRGNPHFPLYQQRIAECRRYFHSQEP